MLQWKIMVLIVALVAAVLGFAGTAVGVAGVIFGVFLVLFVISLIMERRAPCMLYRYRSKAWLKNSRALRSILFRCQQQLFFLNYLPPVPTCTLGALIPGHSE